MAVVRRPAVVAAYRDPAIQRWHGRSMTDGGARSWIDAWPDRWRQEIGAGWAVVDESEVIGQVGPHLHARLDTDGH